MFEKPKNLLFEAQLLKLLSVFFFLIKFSMVQGQATFTATSSGTWGNAATWTISGTDDDAPTNIPDGDDDVIIPAGITVSLSTTQTCNDLVINFGGILLFNGNAFSLSNSGSSYIDRVGGILLNISVPGGNGQWNASANWLGSAPNGTDHVFIASQMNSNVPNTLSGKITISSEGRLENKDIDISDANDSLLVDGTLNTTTNNLDFLSSKVILGNGVISSAGTINLNSNTLTVAAASGLQIQSTVEGGGGAATIVNNGQLTFASGIQNTSFTNEAGAYVAFQHSNLSTGFSLTASAAGNTVEYGFTNAATSVINTTYHHLTLSTSYGNTIGSSVDINGDLKINAATTINSGLTLNIGGDWIHTLGSVASLGATVVFDGSGDQVLSSTPLSTVVFDQLTISKASGSLNSSENIQVNTALNMSLGDIRLNGTKLTLGTGTGAAGTLTHSAGFITGRYEKWVGSTGAYKFPLGNNGFSRILDINITTASSFGSLSAEFMSTTPGTSGLAYGVDINGVIMHNTFSEGYWQLTPANTFSASTYNITAEAGGFSSFEFDTNDDARLLIRTATNWVDGGQSSSSAVAAASPKTVTGNNFTTTLSATLDLAVGSAMDCQVVDAAPVSGESSVCSGNVKTYYVMQAAFLGTSDFKWVVSGGGLITGYKHISGEVFTAITPSTAYEGSDIKYIEVTWPLTGTASALVSVREKAAGCGYGAASTLSVNVGSVPPSAISGRTLVAEGAEGITYTLEGATSGYTFDWSVTNGSIIGSNSGTDLSSITVNWGYVTGEQTISVTASGGGCMTANPVTLAVDIYNVINSTKTGNWGTGSNWEGSSRPAETESARVLSGHNISLTANRTIKNLIIASGGTLSLAGNTLTVTGDIEVYGTISSTAGGRIVMSGANSNIIGTSSAITAGIELQSSNTIYGGSTLGVTGNVSLTAGASVVNNGSFTLSGNLTGASAASTWTNAQGTAASPTLLSVGGSLLSTGTLQAGALYNTVAYTGTGTAVKTPGGSTYLHLTISNNRNTSSALVVKGNLTVSGTVDFGGSITLSGTVAQLVDLTGGTITTSSASGFPSLLVNNAASITLSSNLIIYNGGTLTLTSGIVNTGTYTLSLPNSAVGAVSGGSAGSYINGTLQRQVPAGSINEYFFPVGTAAVYAPVDILESNAATTFAVKYYYALPPNNRTVDAGDGISISGNSYASFVEYWDITTTASARPRLYWMDAARSAIVDISTGADQDLYIAHYDGTDWDFLPTDIHDNGDGTGYITSSVLTAFSPIAPASKEGNSPLPVKIVSFMATDEEQKVRMNWQTTSEKPATTFVIERSADGNHYTTVGKLDGKGMGEHHYSFADNHPIEGLNYYRLRYEHPDMHTGYSQVVLQAFASQNNSSVKIYPNRVKDSFTLDLGSTVLQEVTLLLYDQTGKEIMRQSLQPVATSFKHFLDDDLSAGVYILNILINGREPQSVRLIKE